MHNLTGFLGRWPLNRPHGVPELNQQVSIMGPIYEQTFASIWVKLKGKIIRRLRW